MRDKKLSINIFISYSNLDIGYVNELKKRTIALERKNIINIWHDQQLVTGDKFDEKIKLKLLQSDFIIFLVSDDFISSWYCYEIEFQQALSRLKNSEVKIFPIIIRPCCWEDTDLRLYTSATWRGKAVSEYENTDKAWLEVISSLKKSIAEYNKKTNNEKEAYTSKRILYR